MKKAVFCIVLAVVMFALAACGEEPSVKMEKANVINDKLKNAKKGDYITFGSYEQDNNIANGKEDIEWLVLSNFDHGIFVVSKYALDCQQYNTSDTDVTWETCSLRKWLNETFVNNAFSLDEQNMIKTTTVTADKNSFYDTSPGNDTTDKVFLLSKKEVGIYFDRIEDNRCSPTDYATAQGTWTAIVPEINKDIYLCHWWLRSPGEDSSRAAIVSFDGYFSDTGVTLDYAGVRPAMWIDWGS